MKVLDLHVTVVRRTSASKNVRRHEGVKL